MLRVHLRIAGAALALLSATMPAAASAQYGGYRSYGRGYDAPPPPPPPVYRGYRRGYDAPPPPPAYRGGYGRAGYGGYGRGRARYRCDRGTGGTIIGAIAGGLLGNAAVGRRGDRTAGTIAGAGVGALAGRAIDRDC